MPVKTIEKTFFFQFFSKTAVNPFSKTKKLIGTWTISLIIFKFQEKKKRFNLYFVGEKQFTGTAEFHCEINQKHLKNIAQNKALIP